MESTKTTFKKESGFILAMVGSAIGFANILSFSAQCYKNGGGAFLIPFLVAIVVIGIPLLYLEGLIGSRYGLPIASAYGHNKSNKVAFKMVGWLAAITCLTIGAFYSVLTSWSVAYSYFTAMSRIPADTAHFFVTDFLHDSGSLTIWNGISWPIWVATLLVSVFTWLVMSRDISKGVEKACAFFMPLLFILFGVFTVVVFFLPGASIGFYHYLSPDFSKLLDFALWRDVFGHVFFSFSLGLGIIVGYSRYSGEKANIRKAMLWVAAGDVIFSSIAGLAIFGCVGFMSNQTGIPFHEIVKTDSTFQMGFIIFPQILQHFSPALAPIIGGLFFFCVFIAGITGVFSIVESVAGNVEIEFAVSRKAAITSTIVVMFAMSTFFCMGNGVHILGALQPMVLGNTLLFGALIQIYFFLSVDKTIKNDRFWKNDDGKNSIAFYSAKYVGFSFLALSLIGALYEEAAEPWSAAHLVRWSWLLLALVAAHCAARYVKRA